MKREELRAMGLNEEQVNAIMAQNGQDIEAAKNEAASEKARADDLQEQLDAVRADLQAAQTSAATAAQLRRQLGETQARLQASTKANAIRDALTKHKPRDAAMLARLLDGDKITVADDGTLTGLDEQVETLKQSSAYLFADAPDDQGGTPPGERGGAIDMNAFLRGQA